MTVQKQKAANPGPVRLEREWKVGRPLIGCRFDPTGRFLFASAEDGTVRRLDLLSGRAATFAGHASWVRGIAFIPHEGPPADCDEPSPAGRIAVGGGLAAVGPPPTAPFTVVSADYHGKLVWWRGDLDDPKPIRTVAAHDGWARAVAVSPDGAAVASCGNDHLIKIWSAADGRLLRTLAGHDSHVYNVAFHPAGDRLASGDLRGGVKDWNWQAGRCVRELDGKALHKYDTGFRADIGGARGIAFDPAGDRLAVSGITNVSNAFAGVGNPLVVAFDWATGRAKQLKTKDAFQGTAWSVVFHPAGPVVAAGGGSGGQLWLWQGADSASTHTVTLPTSGRDMALSPTGGRAAVAGANGTAYIYAVALPEAAPQPRRT